MANQLPVLSYYQTRELRGKVADQDIRVVTKPGFPGWEQVSPSVELLAAAAGAAPGAQVALFGAGHGALGVALARIVPKIRLVLLDINDVALSMAERTLLANGVNQATVSRVATLLPGQAGHFDLVLIDIPQSRPLARRWLAEAHELLRPGGVLLVAGPNDQGIQSVIGDSAALFGGSVLLAYKRRCRVARSVRLEEPPEAPDWASEPGIAPGTWAEIDLEVGGRHVQLASLPGVFAYDRLDEGTALLLQHLPDVQGARVLDAGCGYGPIGLAASLGGAARVLMVDVNTLAVAAAQENIARLQASACTAVAGDALAPAEGQQSDLMLSNPPFHTGKQVTYDVAETFIRHGQRLLQPGGRMVLVANRFIRYDRLLGELFAHVETLADDRRYHVLGAW